MPGPTITNNSFAVTRGMLPRHVSDNSLIGGNLTEERRERRTALRKNLAQLVAKIRDGWGVLLTRKWITAPKLESLPTSRPSFQLKPKRQLFEPIAVNI